MASITIQKHYIKNYLTRDVNYCIKDYYAFRLRMVRRIEREERGKYACEKEKWRLPR